ncbi:hypothetical protein VTK56DRAFT_8953 [Thermocarpiscus australiensis]
MFAACRNPASKTIRLPNGRVSDVIGHEYLDVSALDKAWRHALAKVPPTSHIIFDLSLPRPVDDTRGYLGAQYDAPSCVPRHCDANAGARRGAFRT